MLKQFKVPKILTTNRKSIPLSNAWHFS